MIVRHTFNRNGELYRLIADSRGAFVQPALYEAFGLTVIEAMTSGLPTFATSNGGPAEIIEDRVSGFHIDPYHGAAAADIIADFFQRYGIKCKGRHACLFPHCMTQENTFTLEKTLNTRIHMTIKIHANMRIPILTRE